MVGGSEITMPYTGWGAPPGGVYEAFDRVPFATIGEPLAGSLPITPASHVR